MIHKYVEVKAIEVDIHYVPGLQSSLQQEVHVLLLVQALWKMRRNCPFC